MPGLGYEPGLTSNKSTRYLLDYGDFYYKKYGTNYIVILRVSEGSYVFLNL